MALSGDTGQGAGEQNKSFLFRKQRFDIGNFVFTILPEEMEMKEPAGPPKISRMGNPSLSPKKYCFISTASSSK